jgi:hypothetical protein
VAGEWVVHAGSLVRGDFAGAPVGTNVDMNSTIAFVRSDAVGAIEIVVNFGPLTGREATLAENDRLARRLLAIADHVRVHAVRTHDMSDETETIVHQVVVEAEAGQDEAGTLRDACEAWAVECAEERSLEPLEP